MTLADTRAGIAVAMRALAEQTGVHIDTDAVVSRLGPPLEVELANWYPAADVPEMAARYREMYADLAVPATTAMPGAREAIEAVREGGGTTVVVTAKNGPDARRTMEFLELPVDHVVGGLFGSAKGTALREHGASAYVGDHVADVDAARAAAAYSIGVATGPYDEAALLAYGADVALPDLRTFAARLCSPDDREALTLSPIPDES